jgi:hypothetical protein
MTQIIENAEAHYETHEVPFGRTYEWHQAHVILECDCGERLKLTSSITTCRWCGADHAEDLLREEEGEEVVGHRQLGDEVLHPWHYDTQEQTEQHLRDVAAYPKDSPWRYNDITSGDANGE